MRQAVTVSIDNADPDAFADLGRNHDPAERMTAAEDADARQRLLGERLALLNPTDGTLVSRHFGLDGRGASSHQEIAREFNVTRSRISQRVLTAIRRMRVDCGESVAVTC